METCPICCEVIVDATEDAEGQEALFCEGACQKWLHRWCADVHKDSYAILTSSEEPFVCPSCSLAEHCQLVKSLAETVECLKCEIQELKRSRVSPLTRANADVHKEPNQETVSATSKEPAIQPVQVAEQQSLPAPESVEKQTWQTVKPKRRNKRNKGPRADGKAEGDLLAGETRPPKKNFEPRWLNVKDLNPQQHSKQSESIPQCTIGDKTDPIKASTEQPSEKVAGVRRIWGTMRGCSSKTVLTALQRLSTVADKVEVRRKFKKKKNNSVQWWFLIRGHAGTGTTTTGTTVGEDTNPDILEIRTLSQTGICAQQ